MSEYKQYILAIDIGNTNIKLGVFSKDKLICSWRCSTDVKRTSDEYGVDILTMFQSSGIDANCIKGVAISSVVPQVNYTIEHMTEYYFGCQPFVITADNCGMPIHYDNCAELGCDRICNCVSAKYKYTPPLLVIDFGTATTYSYVDANGEFVGGAITLGVKSTIESLANKTAMLPRVEIVRPNKVLSTNTHTAIQSGIYHSTAGQIQHIISSVRQEVGCDFAVIATGGMATLLQEAGLFHHIDRELSLYGIYHIFMTNQ